MLGDSLLWVFPECWEVWRESVRLNGGDFQWGHRWSQGGSAAEMVRDLWREPGHVCCPWGCVGSPRGPGEPGCRALCDLGAEGLFLLVRAVLAELSLEAPGQEDHAVAL